MRSRHFLFPLSLAGIYFALGLVICRPLQANAAASLYISPAGGSFTIGSTFTASIYLDTGGEAVNAVEADLTFPPDKLQVVSPSAGNSFVQVWVTQPTYSNTAGTLKFQGALPSPGIVTTSGLISTITFRVKDIGMAQLKFLGASRVLLNDGKATDILDKVSGANYFLTLPPPEGPLVISRTNPDQGKWYASAIASFEWNAPPDIQGYSYVLDENPGTIPDEITEGLNTRTVYTDVPDGVHYFHIKALRQNSWGGVSDYEVKIDRTPPADFVLNFSPSDYTSDRTPVLSFGTTDIMSGIDHYEMATIALDVGAANENSQPFFTEASAPQVLDLPIGRYDVIVRAFDKAGNYLQKEATLTLLNRIFEVISGKGVRFFGTYTLNWTYVWVLAAIILIILSVLARWVWRAHRIIEENLRHGAAKSPAIAAQLDELRKRQQEYKPPSSGGMKALAITALILLSAMSLILRSGTVRAAEEQATGGPQPPIITLYPKLISNDEILYIGGETNMPKASVLIYLEQADTKATVLKTVTTDDSGNWFYSFPDFLSSGNYVAWAQLKVGEALSPPSAQAAVTIAPTAFQLGTKRLSMQELYLVLVVIFLAVTLALLSFIVYHAYHTRKKKRRFHEEVMVAEESIRRGFSMLRRDIEEELAAVRKMRLSQAASAAEKAREEKLAGDLNAIEDYVGKEVWEMEKKEDA